MISPAPTSRTRSGSRPPRKEPAAAQAIEKLRRWKGPAARTGTPAPGSSGARTSLAPRSAAVRSASAETSSPRRPTTRVEWSRSTASFSAAISSLGVAEPLGVVEADRGQHGDPGGEHVGGVEAAAEAGLDHPGLDPGRRQGDERGGGRDLELGHLLALRERAVDDLGGLRGPRDRGG